MKTFFKVIGIVVLVIVALALIAVAWLSMRKPAQRPASAEKIESTPERIARGKYLVENVTDCLGCHSDHIDTFGYPPKPGTEGQGGFAFTKADGFPGYLEARNITPDAETGIGNWTDGEVLRALREGVDRDGDALFPMMPYLGYAELSDEDAKSIVAYLRTLKPIRRAVKPRSLDVPLNFIVKFMPQPLKGPVSAPNPNDTLAYGKYLSHIAGCLECHTPKDEKHNNIAGKEYSGGQEMKGPWGRNITANLTPHPDAYLGRATQEEFIGRFRAFASIDPATVPAAPKGRNTVMPWFAYAHMSDQDLSAIYTYLKSLPPIENKVNTFPDAK